MGREIINQKFNMHPVRQGFFYSAVVKPSEHNKFRFVLIERVMHGLAACGLSANYFAINEFNGLEFIYRLFERT